MRAFKAFKSIAIPIPLKNIDTDMIIPAQFLTRVTKEGFGENLFQRLRENDKNFPLNLKKYINAKIIIADENFGCGSSREHAAWALVEYGIKVIIAPSFADIFKSNSAKNGLVLIELEREKVKNLLDKAAKENLMIFVDLKNQIIEVGNEKVKFIFDEFTKECILKGIDDLGFLLERLKQIKEFKKEREKNLFYKTDGWNN
ncbi:3-isopropylmalate dehydratase small subunit [Candidatus Peregrinibacteria bacterium RIFOXYC2_FULL_33_13]|nr:MAG: 3-isopropylmalate dehydratase small subunit [Candidatus Peregrinibacteria bacterium GW2011_GWA2_33_10]KKP41288.1 MAG: isopropylmalate isomerase small subunit, 3-isopropylmalate/(R)-2-methylmalate dehydratase small subunit [Candidatus Peregrinibacteria bacterium GW2011_GWC2_33_13]OGJ47469.1 MAG: 3-isopropylmalate dehydratase small subunit [Candidatus Peregrinibacteria bacterium RIFOXYA2_FULL_33_7]OGJ53790.1 MAG: 3-isopropylmalate dehydratase small subunit [Candidatus Peregrinibacteria bac